MASPFNTARMSPHAKLVTFWLTPFVEKSEIAVDNLSLWVGKAAGVASMVSAMVL